MEPSAALHAVHAVEVEGAGVERAEGHAIAVSRDARGHRSRGAPVPGTDDAERDLPVGVSRARDPVTGAVQSEPGLERVRRQVEVGAVAEIDDDLRPRDGIVRDVPEDERGRSHRVRSGSLVTHQGNARGQGAEGDAGDRRGAG